ncbi:hypothetical protein ACH4E5_02295 [Streptomyces afghaniensis]|uniref:hypothetical protein n=1 Tax=Streptomyces afghaniensis TaxID=66865 RepID=UPI0037B8F385
MPRPRRSCVTGCGASARTAPRRTKCTCGDDFIKQAMFEIVRTEGDFLTASPEYGGSGNRFLVQPHPART